MHTEGTESLNIIVYITDKTVQNEYNTERLKCRKPPVCQITQLAYEVKVIGVSGKIEGPSESNHYLSFCKKKK